MQVGFESPSIGALCNSGRKLVQSLGYDTADKIKDLLHYLDVAPTLADLSVSPPILRNQRAKQVPPFFTVGRAGKGQVLFQPYSYTKGQELYEIDSINVISVGGSV